MNEELRFPVKASDYLSQNVRIFCKVLLRNKNLGLVELPCTAEWDHSNNDLITFLQIAR